MHEEMRGRTLVLVSPGGDAGGEAFLRGGAGGAGEGRLREGGHQHPGTWRYDRGGGTWVKMSARTSVTKGSATPDVMSWAATMKTSPSLRLLPPRSGTFKKLPAAARAGVSEKMVMSVFHELNENGVNAGG